MAFSLFDFAGLAFGAFSLMDNKKKAEQLSEAMNQQYAGNQAYQSALMGLMGQREKASQAYQTQMTELARTAGEQMKEGELPAETVARINGLVDYFVGGGEAVNLGILKPQFDALDGAYKAEVMGINNDRGAQMFTIANNLTGEAKMRALLALDKDVADKKEAVRQKHLSDMANLNIQLTNQYTQWALGSKDKDAATKLQTLQTVGAISAAGKPASADYDSVTKAFAVGDMMPYLAGEKNVAGQSTASTGAGIMKLLGNVADRSAPQKTAEVEQVKKAEPVVNFTFPWAQPQAQTQPKNDTDENETFFTEQIR